MHTCREEQPLVDQIDDDSQTDFETDFDEIVSTESLQQRSVSRNTFVFVAVGCFVALVCGGIVFLVAESIQQSNDYLSEQTLTSKESQKEIKNESLDLDEWLKNYPSVKSRNKPKFDYSTLTWKDEYHGIMDPMGNHKSQNKELLDKNEHCEHVFIGDSISYDWLDYQDVFKSQFKTNDNAMVYAHYADVIHNIGWRLNNGNGFENLKHCLLNGKAEQKNLVLLIGTNDIGYIHSSFDVVLRDYNALLQQLVEFIDDVNKKQKVVLHIMAIFPRAEYHKNKDVWNEAHEHFASINYVNEYLQAFAQHEQNENIKFVNCNEMMLDNYGEFGPKTGIVSKNLFRDGLHLSEKGFERWSQCLLQHIDAKDDISDNQNACCSRGLTFANVCCLIFCLFSSFSESYTL